VIVADSSAVVDALAGQSSDPELRARLRLERLHAPYLLDIEVMQAFRGLVRRGVLSADRAADASRDYAILRVTRYPHLPLLERIWQLRDRLSAYDAAFVALAELLDATLVTCDARLAASTGHEARIELYA
jgi:predicted nucleic acid-binding protein